MIPLSQTSFTTGNESSCTLHTALLQLLGIRPRPAREVGSTDGAADHHQWRIRFLANMLKDVADVSHSHIGSGR